MIVMMVVELAIVVVVVVVFVFLSACQSASLLACQSGTGSAAFSALCLAVGFSSSVHMPHSNTNATATIYTIIIHVRTLLDSDLLV